MGTITPKDKHRIIRFWRQLLKQGAMDEEMEMTTHVVTEIEMHEKQSHLVDLHGN